MPFHHIVIYVADIEKSKIFYTESLKPLGYKLMVEFPGFIGFGAEHTDFWLAQLEKGETIGKPAHFAFVAASHEKVDEWYEASIKAGGKDNGKPGPRPKYGPMYYGAFVHDPDGYNIEAVDSTHQNTTTNSN